MLRITPLDHSKRNDWKPWEAKEYVGVSSNSSWYLWVGFGVTMGLIGVAVFGFGLFFLIRNLCSRCQTRSSKRNGGFQRFDESSRKTGKAHASPSGRGTELV